MVQPQALQVGDAVALIAPSSPILSETALQGAVDFVTKLGYRPVLGQSVRRRWGHLAGTDAERAADVNEAFANPKIRGIFAIRGGNGVGRLLDRIDFNTIRANPKFFAGYSDITALHIAINQQAKLITYHTPTLAETDFAHADSYTLERLVSLIQQPTQTGPLLLPAHQPLRTLTPGVCMGVLVGGNLSCLSALMGTPYEVDTRGKLLFIEEVSTPLPRVDRMLHGLRLAGKFEQAIGVVFGDFTNCDASDTSLSLADILAGLEIHKPAVTNFACGHELVSTSLPLGRTYTLDATQRLLCLQ